MIEEEHTKDKDGSIISGVREVRADDGIGMAGAMTVVPYGEAVRFLRRKFILSCGTGRIRRRIRKRFRRSTKARK